MRTNSADHESEPQQATNKARNTEHASRLLLLAILLVALFLRVYRLSEVPAGVDYDEAGNFILAGEIAAGQSRPVFIRAYAGREAVFYWLAAGTMRLLGRTLFGFRLAAALCGVGSVLLAYLLARELFPDDGRGGMTSPLGGMTSPLGGSTPPLGGSTPPLGGMTSPLGGMTPPLPLLTAALMAVSYWQVHANRYGFRVNSMVLLLTATMVWLWRGLRRDNWWDLVLAGLLCGLSANTYLAIRAFPLVLLVFAAWVILTWKASNVKRPHCKNKISTPSRKEAKTQSRLGRRTRTYTGVPALRPGILAPLRFCFFSRVVKRQTSMWRVGQFAVFGLAALAAFAPLGVFFLRNPEFFSTRMSQASVFDPEIHGGDLWGTLGRVALDALGIFTIRGDGNPVYNYAQKPIYGPVLGACFYLGLLVCVWRLVCRGGSLRARSLRSRTPYLLLLVWLPVMLVPNVLGARGVPHSLRSMGIIPAVYMVAALGIGTAWQVGERLLEKKPGFVPRSAWAQKPGFSLRPWAGPALVLVLVVWGGAQTYHRYFNLWTQDAGAYYGTAADIRHAAEYLSGWDADEVALYVSNDTYRHTTIAAFATNYEQLKWVSGATLVLPVESERPALYVFDHTNPLDPLLARYLPAWTLQHRELGPDGKIGFEAYLVPRGWGHPEQVPMPEPQAPGQGNRSAPSRQSLGNTLAFLGYDLNASAISGDTLDVTLYWRVLAPVDREDWTFFAHLVDDRGFRWGGETFFNYPSSQWAPGEVILFRKQIAIAPGAPPGPYTLDVGVFSPSLDARLPALNEDGQLSGTTVGVGPIDVARAPAPPEELPPIQQPLQARFGEALILLGSDRDRSDLRPGETLALSLYWLLEAPVGAPVGAHGAGWGQPGAPVQVALWLEGDRHADGAGRVPLWEGDPVQGRYPFAEWQPPEFVRDRYALRVPLDIEAGDYDLRLAVFDRNGETTAARSGQHVVTTSGAVVGSNDMLPEAGSRRFLSLGTIHIHASDRLWEPPPFEHAVGARLGDAVELLGYDLGRPESAPGGGGPARPGETLHLTLIWRCLREMEAGYTVFTHLLDEGEQVRGQQDNPPVGGRYPTTLWAPGEVVVDEYELTIQAGAPPGTYVIEVGMYDPATMQRLPVLDPTGVAGDRVLLGNIAIQHEEGDR